MPLPSSEALSLFWTAQNLAEHFCRALGKNRFSYQHHSLSHSYYLRTMSSTHIFVGGLMLHVLLSHYHPYPCHFSLQAFPQLLQHQHLIVTFSEMSYFLFTNVYHFSSIHNSTHSYSLIHKCKEVLPTSPQTSEK